MIPSSDSLDSARLFDQVRYIKLGTGSAGKDKACIEGGIAYIGFGSSDELAYAAASRGDWDSFRNLYLARDADGSDQARKKRATSATNQVKAFFEADNRTLWVTFYAGKLFYGSLCSNDRPKIDAAWGGCTRLLVNGWSDIDACGVPLKVENLSGNLTKVRGFQGTSCALGDDQVDYLLRRLSGKVPEYIMQIDKARQSMVAAVLAAIRSLQPKDFELLVEIIFSRSWRRIGQMGGIEKFIDIVYEDPLNPERRIAVQVKSETTVGQIVQYSTDEQLELYEKLFFVFHSPTRSEMLTGYDAPEKLELIDGERLANLVVDSGLVHWLRDKTS
jgi:hypothetical protein